MDELMQCSGTNPDGSSCQAKAPIGADWKEAPTACGCWGYGSGHRFCPSHTAQANWGIGSCGECFC